MEEIDAHQWGKATHCIEMNDLVGLKKWLEIPEHKQYLTMYDDTGNTLLNKAIIYSLVDMVECLIDAGADVNQADPYRQQTALHLSASQWGGDIKILECLIRKGADVNFKSASRQSALHFGLDLGSMKVIRTLVEAKADLQAVDEPTGYSILHFAICKENRAAIELFLAHGADVHATTKAGVSLLDFVDSRAFESSDFAPQIKEMIRSKQEQLALTDALESLKNDTDATASTANRAVENTKNNHTPEGTKMDDRSVSNSPKRL